MNRNDKSQSNKKKSKSPDEIFRPLSNNIQFETYDGRLHRDESEIALIPMSTQNANKNFMPFKLNTDRAHYESKENIDNFNQILKQNNTRSRNSGKLCLMSSEQN